jgi:hypothetical protein
LPNSALAKKLFANWPAKVLSLAAALLLFSFYRLNRLEDRYFSVPLSVSMNDEYVVASQYPRSVRVHLRGESNDLFAIQEDDVKAGLDLTSFRAEGKYRAPVQIERKGSALGVDPLEIRTDPADIVVSMEKRIMRVVPITPSFKGFLEPGYELVSFELSPSEVEISGPAGSISKVVEEQTDFIELAGRNSDFIVKTRLVRKDSLVSVSGPESIEFRAVVQRSLAIKDFEGVAIAAQGLSPELALASPLPAGKLRVRSSTSDIALFTPSQGILYVDLSEMRKAGAYKAKVRSRAPDGFTIERFEPQELQVTVVAAGALPQESR